MHWPFHTERRAQVTAAILQAARTNDWARPRKLVDKIAKTRGEWEEFQRYITESHDRWHHQRCFSPSMFANMRPTTSRRSR